MVPEGGISCSIPVTKNADPTVVTAGQSFTFDITITNPFDCILSQVKVLDVITSNGPTFKVVGSTPSATISGGTVRFNSVADLKPHSSATLTIKVSIPANSPGGKLKDVVHVAGTCGKGTATGTATGVAGSGGIPLTGTFTLNAPTVNAVSAKPKPRTG